MKPFIALALAFVSGAFQIVTASRLADDGSVTAWVGVGILGLLIFEQAILMALVSLQWEREINAEELA